MQGAGLLLNNWHRGIVLWASNCARSHKQRKFSLPLSKGNVGGHWGNTASIIVSRRLKKGIAYCAHSKINGKHCAKKIDSGVHVFPLQIAWGACGLVMTGNVIIFLTIFGFFVVFGGGDDFSWEQW